MSSRTFIFSPWKAENNWARSLSTWLHSQEPGPRTAKDHRTSDGAREGGAVQNESLGDRNTSPGVPMLHRRTGTTWPGLPLVLHLLWAWQLDLNCSQVAQQLQCHLFATPALEQPLLELTAVKKHLYLLLRYQGDR